MGSVVHAIERFQSIGLGQFNSSGYLAAYSAASRYGGERGLAGMQGSGAESMIGSIDSAIRSPGGGLAGNVALYRALDPTGSMSPFMMDLLREQGAFGSRSSVADMMRRLGLDIAVPGGDDSRSNLSMLMGYAGKAYGDPLVRAGAMANLTGMSSTQWLGWEGAYKQYGAQGMDGYIDKAREFGVDVNSLGGEQIRDLVGILAADPSSGAGREALESQRKRFLGNMNLSRDEAGQLNQATPEENLQGILARMVGKHGIEMTPDLEALKSTAQYLSLLSDVGGPLIAGVTGTKDAVVVIKDFLTGSSDQKYGFENDPLLMNEGEIKAGREMGNGFSGITNFLTKLFQVNPNSNMSLYSQLNQSGGRFVLELRDSSGATITHDKSPFTGEPIFIPTAKPSGIR